jgi:hypothetical protein
MGHTQLHNLAIVHAHDDQQGQQGDDQECFEKQFKIHGASSFCDNRQDHAQRQHPSIPPFHFEPRALNSTRHEHCHKKRGRRHNRLDVQPPRFQMSSARGSVRQRR